MLNRTHLVRNGGFTQPGGSATEWRMLSDTALLIMISAQSSPVKGADGILEISHMSNYFLLSLSSNRANV